MSDKAREKFDALLVQLGLSVAEGFYVGNGYGDGHVCVYQEGKDGWQHHLHMQDDPFQLAYRFTSYRSAGDEVSYDGHDIVAALAVFDYLDCPVVPTTKWQLEPERHDPFPKTEREARVAEWFASHPEASSVDLIEFRPPNVDDVLDHLLGAALNAIEAETLSDNVLWDAKWECGPLIAEPDPKRPAHAKLRAALREYLLDTMDLSESCWQPTGRRTRWHVGGRTERIAP